MRVALVGATDRQDGAGRAMWRLHRALLAFGVTSRMLVREKISDEWTVEGEPAGRAWSLARKSLGRLLLAACAVRDGAVRSVNAAPTRLSPRLLRSSADIVHLHWIGSDSISIAEIGRLKRPLVWTLHDMWAFCGSLHYDADQPDARWRTGYPGTDLDAMVWRRKKSCWKQPVHLIAPSRWLAACVRESALLSTWPVTVVPNVIDTDAYQPLDRVFCRRTLGLPEDVPILLFGAIGGRADRRKGFDLLEEALRHLGRDGGLDPLCVVFGETAPARPPELPFRIRWLGRLHDDATLALLYNAADVMVVPSRLDVLPQTATEAQACGCPVVAFGVAGLPDAVVHGQTGYLAHAGDAADLAAGIGLALGDRDRRAAWAAAARVRAVELWSAKSVVPKVLSVYAEAAAAAGRETE